MPPSPPASDKKKSQFIGTLVILLAIVALLQWTSNKGLISPADDGDFPESTIPWRDDFASAIDESNSTGKPVLVVFSASWCPPCKIMKREVWPDPTVAAAVEADFVPIYVDVDLKQHSSVVSRYQVRSIPTILIVDGQGDIVRQAGPMSKEKAIRFLTADRT